MIIENLHGEKEYVSLPAPIYIGDNRFFEDFGTGVMLSRVWFGPRTRRAFVETDSIWQDRRTHGCVGKRTHEVELEELLRICENFGITVPSGIEPAEID